MNVLGIDEAGRGAVIGPLVIAGVEVEKNAINKLKDIQVKDSKKLTPNTRERLAHQIRDIASNIYVEIIYPKEIDEWVIKRNLNLLEEHKVKKIISKSNASLIIVDSFSANAFSLKQRLSSSFPTKEFIVEHKADNKYEVVSAASIIAKVTRDKLVKALAKDIGSGYPSDPITQKFLKKALKDEKLKNQVRHSWETVERLKKGTQKKLFL
ncbi:MAG: ribonuclease HII [Candidatus Nanohaloarchaeota archaeon]|nr:ribonuclease HII [Candidatus Nanohaloarchaeota archaeon]